MGNTYHQIYLQIVFAVKYRRAVINPAWQSTLNSVVATLIADEGCKSIIVNGVEDHLHCFVGMLPHVSPSDLMKSVKAKSSKYINDHRLTPVRFEWQRGFGVFSYSRSHIPNVYNYIANQYSHHHRQTFRAEYIEFLEKFEVEYDERYIFEELSD